MHKTPKRPFYIVGSPLIAMGTVFIAVGLSGQPAFGYTGVGLLIPGVVMVVGEFFSRSRRAGSQ